MNKKFILFGLICLMLLFTNIVIAPGPQVNNECPTDGCILWDMTTTRVNVTVALQGGNVNWTIYTSPDIGNASGINETTGNSKNCTISGLQYSTTYTWTVNVTDYLGSPYVNESYTFTTRDAKLRENPALNEIERGLIALIGIVILLGIIVIFMRMDYKKEGAMLKVLMGVIITVILIGLMFSVL